VRRPKAPIAHPVEPLATFHIVGGSYLLISSIFSEIVKASELILSLYVTFGALGLFVGYGFYRLRVDWLVIVSAVVTAASFAITLLLFLLGLMVGGGVVGPSWLIFVASGWALLRMIKASRRTAAAPSPK